MLERLNALSDPERELFHLELGRPEDLPETLALPSRHFVCLLAWDADQASTQSITRLARSLLAAGAAYVCTWGRGCERVHDLFDEEIVSNVMDEDTDSTIMTTWHDDETLVQAAWFALFVAFPTESFARTCRAVVGVTVGSPVYAAEVRTALRSPERLAASP
jgi:hypothetical protein